MWECDWSVVHSPTESNEFILYAVRRSIHRYDLATGTDQRLPLSGLREAVALDFDYDRNCVYWADISLDIIQVGWLTGPRLQYCALCVCVSSKDICSLKNYRLILLHNMRFIASGMLLLCLKAPKSYDNKGKICVSDLTPGRPPKVCVPPTICAWEWR